MIENFNVFVKDMKDYRYLGEEECNGFECIVISFNCNYENKIIKYKIWIIKEKGVITKISFDDESIDYIYEFNCVTDEDVKIPDLSDYKMINMN